MRMKAEEAFVKMLWRHGVRDAFGISGTTVTDQMETGSATTIAALTPPGSVS